MAKLKEEQLATEVRTSATSPEITQSTKPKATGLTVSQKSQHSLVAGAIKRKGSVLKVIVTSGCSSIMQL